MIYAAIFMVMVVMIALLIGAWSPGKGVYAFTVDPLMTRDIYVMDIDRDLFYAVQVYGHENESPAWSREHRWLVFDAR
ncbi:MAG: hypothetical protein K8L97_05330 [Anaerolineae bacterium]|nr:hypothetical protein [Anaerolineae bacterium]